MAKKLGQPKPDVWAKVRSYLQAGKTLEDAASCAGITYPEVVELINKSNDNGSEAFGAANIVAANVLLESLAVLKDLLNTGDNDEIRLGAAKELRRFAFDLIKINKPKSVVAEIKVEERDLWDS